MQKVDLGNKAPELRERAGMVADDSLAAESYRKDGEFAKNASVKPEKFQTDQNIHSGPKAAQQGNGGSAPSYLVDTQLRDRGGPHGKNIREENLDLPDNSDGLKRALRSEPGSEDDPSRLAEQQLQGQNAISGSAPPVRDTAGGNSFGNLDNNRPS
ncbi:hypothetical protein ISF_02077 [Cordyceps fumosorosea ARSEF 2679]|uniref:Uncharacterized protein n=1 Tax=Cordyceps fumosorosea (strain ARSEF 2679) TaxID=1081104 RepID=A0A168CLI3_CORFA|nr:hypothetical protein ISF_02077 [Cordyceps fumosorosea ARSEF 2679]OAA71526.1 hypothetical protein ISF_02077 [Cordyceps fumosorosea ARSEF 2679]